MDLLKSHYRQYRVNLVDNPQVTLPEHTRQKLAVHSFTPQLMELYGILQREFSDRWVDHIEFRTRLVGIDLPQRRKRKPENELRVYGAYGYWGRNAFETFMNQFAMWNRSGAISTRSGVWFAAQKLVPDLALNEAVGRLSRVVASLREFLSPLGARIVRHPLAGDPRYATIVVEDMAFLLRQISEHNEQADVEFKELACGREALGNYATMEEIAACLGRVMPVHWRAPTLYFSDGRVLRYGEMEQA